MKIAVCLSGQPRTIFYTVDNIKKFFSNHDTDYFCHAWDYNSYKIKNPDTSSTDKITWEDDSPANLQEFHQAMVKINPKQVVVEGKHDLPMWAEWSSLFYSLMMANHYKKMYEMKNNFRYDFVFRATYQHLFAPDTQFNPPVQASRNNYLDLYGLFRSRMPEEYNRINLSDHCFYGSSTAMDIFCDTYKYAYEDYIMKRRMDDWDPIGPGCMLSGVCDTYNLDFTGGMFISTNYRKECIPKDGILNYWEIAEFNNSLY